MLNLTVSSLKGFIKIIYIFQIYPLFLQQVCKIKMAEIYLAFFPDLSLPKYLVMNMYIFSQLSIHSPRCGFFQNYCAELLGQRSIQ